MAEENKTNNKVSNNISKKSSKDYISEAIVIGAILICIALLVNVSMFKINGSYIVGTSPNTTMSTTLCDPINADDCARIDDGVQITEDILTEIAEGGIPGASLIHKFGATEIDTTIHSVTRSTFYRTPTTAMNLEFVSGSADDSSTGIGAREVTIFGLNSTWHEVNQTLITNGTTPVQLSIPLTRLYRWYVSSSGTYATETTGSHQGVLTIRETGAGDTWSQITMSPFAMGQSQIGVYTIPAGKTGYLLTKNVFTDSRFTSDIYLFQRCKLNDTTSPYSGIMRLIEREVGVTGGFSINFRGGKGPFVGPCDIGFMGEVTTGTAEVSTEFELVQVNSE